MKIRTIVFFIIHFIVTSCNSGKSKRQVQPINQWVVNNKEQIDSDIDSIVNNYLQITKIDSNWSSSTVIITKYAPNILGRLAEKMGDSTSCIVVELTFYKDPSQKKNIMIASEDSTCLNKLQQIHLETDSTDKFIFGKIVNH